MEGHAKAWGDTNIHSPRKCASGESSLEDHWSGVSVMLEDSVVKATLAVIFATIAEAEQGNYPANVHGPDHSAECRGLKWPIRALLQ